MWTKKAIERIIVLVFGGALVITTIAEDAVRSTKSQEKGVEKSKVAAKNSKDSNERDSAPHCTGIGGRCGL